MQVFSQSCLLPSRQTPSAIIALFYGVARSQGVKALQTVICQTCGWIPQQISDECSNCGELAPAYLTMDEPSEEDFFNLGPDALRDRFSKKTGQMRLIQVKSPQGPRSLADKTDLTDKPDKIAQVKHTLEETPAQAAALLAALFQEHRGWIKTTEITEEPTFKDANLLERRNAHDEPPGAGALPESGGNAHEEHDQRAIVKRRRFSGRNFADDCRDDDRFDIDEDGQCDRFRGSRPSVNEGLSPLILAGAALSVFCALMMGAIAVFYSTSLLNQKEMKSAPGPNVPRISGIYELSFKSNSGSTERRHRLRLMQDKNQVTGDWTEAKVSFHLAGAVSEHETIEFRIEESGNPKGETRPMQFIGHFETDDLGRIKMQGTLTANERQPSFGRAAWKKVSGQWRARSIMSGKALGD